MVNDSARRYQPAAPVARLPWRARLNTAPRSVVLALGCVAAFVVAFDVAAWSTVLR